MHPFLKNYGGYNRVEMPTQNLFEKKRKAFHWPKTKKNHRWEENNFSTCSLFSKIIIKKYKKILLSET